MSSNLTIAGRFLRWPVVGYLVVAATSGAWPVHAQTPSPATADSVALQLDRYLANPVASAPPRLDGRHLSAFFGQLRMAATDWIGANGPTQPHRRLALATYVLDLINAQDATTWSSQSLFTVSSMIDWAGDILRGSPPLHAERDWYIAAAAMLELYDPDTRASPIDADRLNPLTRLFDSANARFPQDPLWQLGHAIAADLQTFPDSHNGHLAVSSLRRDDGPFISPAAAAAIRKTFTTTAAIPAVRQEVELRWGYFELRLGRPTEALAHFRAVGDTTDVFMRYWLDLFEGRAFEETHAPDDAVAAYRRAVEAVPNAQSATVALAAALVADHHTSDAIPLVNAMLKAPDARDPWVWYACPDCRSWPQAIANLRKASAP